jgi:hypothetical protein
VILLVLAACSSGSGKAAPQASATAAAATPTEPTAVPTATAESENDSDDSAGPPEIGPATTSGSDDLSDLPDDPQALMLASLNRPLSRVARKMANSGNKAFIPVLLEFMRFQPLEEGSTSVASFMSRIKDNVPLDQEVVFPQEERRWDWWVEWVGRHPEIQPPDGYAGWKGRFYSLIDPRMGAFLYDGVKTEIRLEEIAWGGVVRDGIPDLRNPPVLSAGEADYLNPDDRVFGVSINGEHRAYPLRILNPHEMANDVVGGVPFALAY